MSKREREVRGGGEGGGGVVEGWTFFYSFSFNN